jgi:hypothetical protein
MAQALDVPYAAVTKAITEWKRGPMLREADEGTAAV